MYNRFILFWTWGAALHHGGSQRLLHLTASSLPLPAASSPRHAFNWLLVNGVFRKVCIIVHGAVPKRGESLPDSAKMLLLFGRMARMHCHNDHNGCAPDF